ncbi:MAG: sucrase ferredoxin [Microlunatus sp.]|nr:sucrase ferredoxin [Microlunatus sp.]MDN5770300.1 sucrase ferredoxin [Microlunatus sp.]MDN5804319.1 sucrase ferredoxin [Microlunatus sp.]
MSPDPAFRCATAARERGDPPLGTAPVARSFLLIEHPGPWRFDALAGTDWSAGIKAELTAAVRDAGARLLLIRRPGRRRRHGPRSWGAVRVGGSGIWGTWHDERDLGEAAAALRSAVGSTPPDAAPTAAANPVLLVCAHGVHDACCAVRGRPVAAALAERWPAATWECSHVGGDRFAANLVVLPDGTYYGNLGQDSAVAVVSDHFDGRVDPGHLRGSTRWAPPAQAAVGAIHRHFGPFGVDQVAPESILASQSTPDRPLPDQLSDRARPSWQVTVTGPGLRWQVDVVATQRPAAVLTCAAQRPTSSTAYRILEIRSARPDQNITIR